MLLFLGPLLLSVVLVLLLLLLGSPLLLFSVLVLLRRLLELSLPSALRLFRFTLFFGLLLLLLLLFGLLFLLCIGKYSGTEKLKTQLLY